MPMIYNLDALDGANNTIEHGSARLLGMNEPGEKKNESAADVAARWPEMEALADRFSPPLKLGTPAPGGLRLPHAVQWLHDFFGNCSSCRVDFVAVHWYMCNGRTDAAAQTSAENMMNWLEMVHTTFKREVWLTEFNCGDGAAPQPLANQSAANHLRFMRAALPLLDALHRKPSHPRQPSAAPLLGCRHRKCMAKMCGAFRRCCNSTEAGGCH